MFFIYLFIFWHNALNDRTAAQYLNVWPEYLSNRRREEYHSARHMSEIESTSFKAIKVLSKRPKTELTCTWEENNAKSSWLGGGDQNASFSDWVRCWVLTQTSPRRLFYLSKAQFRLFGTKAACSCCKGRTCHSAHVCHPRGSWKAERRTTDSQSLASLLHKLARSHANKSNSNTLASLHLAEFSRLADPPVCSVYAGVGAFAAKHGKPGWCSRCWREAGMQGNLPGAASQLCCRCKKLGGRRATGFTGDFRTFGLRGQRFWTYCRVMGFQHLTIACRKTHSPKITLNYNAFQ